MRNENKNGCSFGRFILNLCQFLSMLFCTLRACNVITWKWYWIMSPLFILEIICVVALIIVGAGYVISEEDDDMEE